VGFAERMQAAMDEKQMTQKGLSKLTGINQGSISLYLHGTSKPKQDTLERLEEVLGPLEDPEEKEPESGNQDDGRGSNAVFLVADAMGTSPDVIRAGIQQGVFPWAYGVKRQKRWVYIINLAKFESVEGIKVKKEA